MSLLLPHSRDCLAEYSTESPHSSVVRIVLHRANSNPVCLSPRETRQEGGYHMYLIRHFERHAAGNNSASQVNWLADIHQIRVRHNLFPLVSEVKIRSNIWVYGLQNDSISVRGQLTLKSDWNRLIAQTTHFRPNWLEVEFWIRKFRAPKLSESVLEFGRSSEIFCKIFGRP